MAILPRLFLRRHSRPALVGLVLLVGLLLRLPAFSRPLLSSDEAVYATTGEAMRHGAVLYRDIVDHKPPAIYDVYFLSAEVLGPFDTQLAHALVILAVLLTGFALSRAALRMGADPRAGWMAALLWVVFSTAMPDFDALAANGELFLLAAQAVAFAWVLSRLGRRRVLGWETLFGAGVLTGVAVAFKFQGATFLAVPGTALVIEAWWRRRTVAGALGGLAVTLAGTAVVPALYLLRASVDGSLGSMWFWFDYNAKYLNAGPHGWEVWRLGLLRTALLGTAAFLPYAFGLTATWRWMVEWWRRGLARTDQPGAELVARTLAEAWLAGSVIALCAGGRFFGHYFHLVLPALSLLAAGPLLAFWDRFARPRVVRVAVVLLFAGPALGALAVTTVLRPEVMGRLDPKPPYEQVAARLHEISGRNDTIFVWGHSTEVYVLARRRDGTRFMFCDYLTGTSPGTDSQTGLADPKSNVVGPAWRMLFDDLARRKPRFLVDASTAGWDHYGAFPMTRYPRLEAYVKAHYRERERVAGVTIYERSVP